MSDLAYYINQLEKFDPTFHEPLMITTAGRDVQFNVAGFDIEITSFVQNTFGGTGSQEAQGFPWIAANGNSAPGVSVDSDKVNTPFRYLQRNVTYSQLELNKSVRTGQPIDTAKLIGLNKLYQLNIDKAVYLGAQDNFANFQGLVNSDQVTNVADVALGVSGFTEWTTKTPDEIVQDINSAIDSAWQASGLQFPPNKVLLPPANFSYICSQKVSDAGNVSILNYIKMNCIATEQVGSVDIKPLKFLTAGPNGAVIDKNRMVVYTNDYELVRFPYAPVMGGPAWQMGFDYFRPYMYGLGQMEFVYPMTFAYRDGI